MERKEEAQNPFFRVVELTDDTIDPAVWGKNFPLQYDAYRRTVDQQRTRYGGSEADAADADRGRPAVDRGAIAARGRPAPEDDVGRLCVRGGLPQEAWPRLHARGPDASPSASSSSSSRGPASTATPRSTCRTRRPGGGDLIKGFEHYNQMPYAEARKEFTHPVACIDCHEPTTMALRVTRPGFIEGIRALKAGQGVNGLRREHDGDAAGDAHLRLRPVSRRVLLQGPGEAAHLSVGRRA